MPSARISSWSRPSRSPVAWRMPALARSYVQTAGSRTTRPITNIYIQFDQTAKGDVVERKIRVVYLASDAAPANDSVCYSAIISPFTSSNSHQVHDEEPPAYTSPGGANFQTPAPKKVDSDEPSPIPAPDFSEKTSQSPQREPTSAISNAKSAVANSLPSSDELKSQLSEANAQIQRLKDRLADQGLRQRKTGGEATSKAVPATMQQSHAPTAGGVSIQGVACLCLLSFLIAYFFF